MCRPAQEKKTAQTGTSGAGLFARSAVRPLLAGSGPGYASAVHGMGGRRRFPGRPLRPTGRGLAALLVMALAAAWAAGGCRAMTCESVQTEADCRGCKSGKVCFWVNMFEENGEASGECMAANDEDCEGDEASVTEF